MNGPGGAAILVPSARHLAAELGARGEGALIRGRIFRDFVIDAAARLAPDVTPATPHTTRLFTRTALDHIPAQRLAFPAEPAARVALANAIDRAIGRLRRAGTGAEHLHAIGSSQALLLAEVLERVDEMLEGAGLADARSAAGIVARRLAGGDVDLPEVSAERVTVTGIAAWEPDDLAVLEALHRAIRRAGGAGIALELPSLAGPIARAPDDAIGPIAGELERRWASLDDAPEIEWTPARRADPREVIMARNIDGEARAVVATVLDALGRGTPPERIAIVVPDLDETRLTPFRAALGDARVPFTEPRGRPVASCPEGRIALALLATAVGPVTREQVIELLRAPGIAAGAWTERAEGREAAARAALLAHRLREVPVEIDRTGGMLLDALGNAVKERPEEAWMPRALDRLLRNARWLGESDDARTMPSRRELGRRLIALVDRLKLGQPDRKELADAMRAEVRAAAQMARGTMVGEPHWLRTGGLALRALGEGAAAVRAIREAVRALVDGAAAAGLADRPSSPADFAAELSVAVAELGIGLGASPSAAGASAVRLGKPADLAGLAHDLVIVTGLEEHAYSGAERDEALLDERVRKQLPVPVRPPSAGQRETWRRAELAWAMAGSDRVVLSYALGDEGDLASPHRLVRWAEELGATTRKEPASRVSRGASRIDPRSAELCALAAGTPPRGDVADRVAVERARTAFFLDPRAFADRHSGKVALEGDEARRRFVIAVGGDAPERPVAVTAIERAAGCAFAGFARRVLRVRRVEDLVESADARERGTLVHKALHAAFEGAQAAGPNADPATVLARARAAAEQALGGGATMPPLRREAVMAAVEDAVGVVARALEGGDPLRFHVAEKSFGSEGAPWGSLAVGGDDGPVIYVDGQIDRVDVTTDGRRARVVDYKTGRIPVADDHGKSAFQLPLYAAVVARELACDEVEAVYVSVRPRGIVEEWPRSEDDRRALGARRDEIAGAARRVILGMWQGEVAPRPAKAALCARCEARDVCRRPAVAPIEEAEERAS
ncbi:MAG: PD-(D/E)XK nuclease family protein [Minicystis sp.]